MATLKPTLSEGTKLPEEFEIELMLARRIRAVGQTYSASEVHPFRFGPVQDALSTVSIITTTIVLINVIVYAIGSGAVFAPSASNMTWSIYQSSNEVMVGMLLSLWIIGYNLISFVVYQQYERRERQPPDDFHVDFSGCRGGDGRGAQNTLLLVALPDSKLAIASKDG